MVLCGHLWPALIVSAVMGGHCAMLLSAHNSHALLTIHLRSLKTHAAQGVWEYHVRLREEYLR